MYAQDAYFLCSMDKSEVDMQFTGRAPAEWNELVAACDKLLKAEGERTRDLAHAAFKLVEATCDQEAGEKVRYHSFGKLTCHYSQLIEEPRNKQHAILNAATALASSIKGPLKVVHIDAWVMSAGFSEVTEKAARKLTPAELLLSDVVHGVSHNRAKRAESGSGVLSGVAYSVAIASIARGGVTQKTFREAIMGGASKLFKEGLMLNNKDNLRPITETDDELRLLGERLRVPASAWTAVRIDALNTARNILCEKDGVLQAQNLPKELAPVANPMDSFHEGILVCPAQFVRNKNVMDDLPTGAVHQVVRLLPEIIIETRQLL